MKKLRFLLLPLTFFISCCSYNVEPFIGNINLKGKDTFFQDIVKGGVDKEGNFYLPDTKNNKIMKINEKGVISNYFSIDDDKELNPYKKIKEPYRIIFDNEENMYVNYAYSILKIEKKTNNKYFLDTSTILSICGFDSENNLYFYGGENINNSNYNYWDYSFLKLSSNNKIEKVNYSGTFKGGL